MACDRRAHACGKLIQPGGGKHLLQVCRKPATIKTLAVAEQGCSRGIQWAERGVCHRQPCQIEPSQF